MAWSRRNTLETRRTVKSISCLSKGAKKHAKLQLWLWRKRQENGIFRMSKFKRQVLKSFFCSQPQSHFNTKRNQRKSKTFGSSDATSSFTNVNERKDFTKLEICKVNNGDCLSPSSAVDCSAVHSNWNGAVNDLLLYLPNVNSGANDDCVHIEADQNVTTDEILTTENNVGDEKSECLRPKISKKIREYLCGFHQKYGSLFPLEKSAMLKHLTEKFNKDFKDCEIMILEIIIEEMANIVNTAPCFEVKYKKHRLTMDDLSTLANENWLNDQVINMYGELIMESAHSKVIKQAIS